MTKEQFEVQSCSWQRQLRSIFTDMMSMADEVGQQLMVESFPVDVAFSRMLVKTATEFKESSAEDK